MRTLTSELTPSELATIMWLDLLTFVHTCFCELNPTSTFYDAPHLHVMAAKLEATLSGRGPKRLIINLPPRSLKSITVSVAAVAWSLGHSPFNQIICASYGQDLADKHARDTRTIMLSQLFRKIFPGTRLSAQKLSVNDFATTQHGFRMATSVGGVLTGRGGNILIIDDPLKPDDALSETRRNAVNEWYDNTLLSRLNNKEDGIIIIVMQRLHQDDLVGHVLSKGENWDVLSFPAIAEIDERHIVDTALGRSVFERKIGQVLDPRRESLQTLEWLRQSMGSYSFSAQYQQDPMPVGGAMIQLDWLIRYDPDAPLPRFTSVLQSWDTANKSGELNDFSVCTTWGVYDRRYYLLDVYRGRLNYPELKRKILELNARHKPNSIIIEDKASGTQLIQDLRADGLFCVKPYDPPPQTDKIMRLNNQTALFESGRVLLPTRAAWLTEYVRELTSFPGSKFDDQVDSTAQALDYMAKNRTAEMWARLAG